MLIIMFIVWGRDRLSLSGHRLGCNNTVKLHSKTSKSVGGFMETKIAKSIV